jgi:hypothetical protein
MGKIYDFDLNNILLALQKAYEIGLIDDGLFELLNEQLMMDNEELYNFLKAERFPLDQLIRDYENDDSTEESLRQADFKFKVFLTKVKFYLKKNSLL